MATGSTTTWTTWTFDPLVVLWGAAAAAAFQGGLMSLRRARRRQGKVGVVSSTRIAAFWAGLVVLIIAMVSPLEGAAHELFAWHMVQHLLIGLVAPLLFVTARPVRVCSALLPPALRRRTVRCSHVVARRARFDPRAPRFGMGAAVLHTAVTGAWHVPVAYDGAVAHPWLHAIEHVSMFAAGLGLWWAVGAGRWRARGGLAVLYLFIGGLGTGAVAALLTLSPHALYRAHLASSGAWGLTALEDQQLAGAIMWVPGGMVYAVAATLLFVRWLEAGPSAGALTVGSRS